MAIPLIESYPIPTSIARDTAAWTVDPNRAALLLHDVQNYFLAPYDLDRSPGRELMANAVRMRDAAARAGIPVIFSAQPGDMTRDQRGLLHDFWGPGMARSDADRAIVAELTPGPGDVVVTKWRYSAFVGTDLLDRMRALGRDQLIVTGVYANTGCLMTAVDAFSQDIQPFFVSDAVADFSPADHAQALAYAASRCARVLTSDQVLRDLVRP